MADLVKRARLPSGIALAAALVGVLVLIRLLSLMVQDRDPASSGIRLHVSSGTPAALAAAEQPKGSEERELLSLISDRPVARWIAGATRTAEKAARGIVTEAERAGEVAQIVAYNIPGRDCGGYSASQERVDAASYRDWIDALVRGLGSHRAIVVLEPDAVAQFDCLDEESVESRVDLLGYAVDALVAQGSWVYIDAGHSGWIEPEVMAERLQRVNVSAARGFALNVSNFRSTEEEIAYGTAVAEALGTDARFVIDTSRNGVEPTDREWCNPPGAGLGIPPTTDAASPLVDAYLWIKTPGNSDGDCNGGPPAGEFWLEYALDLARNAVRPEGSGAAAG